MVKPCTCRVSLQTNLWVFFCFYLRVLRIRGEKVVRSVRLCISPQQAVWGHHSSGQKFQRLLCCAERELLKKDSASTPSELCSLCLCTSSSVCHPAKMIVFSCLKCFISTVNLHVRSADRREIFLYRVKF